MIPCEPFVSLLIDMMWITKGKKQVRHGPNPNALQKDEGVDGHTRFQIGWVPYRVSNGKGGGEIQLCQNDMGISHGPRLKLGVVDKNQIGEEEGKGIEFAGCVKWNPFVGFVDSNNPNDKEGKENSQMAQIVKEASVLDSAANYKDS